MKRPPSDSKNHPARTSCALLLIDVINDLEFPNGKKLFKHAIPAAKRIAALKKRAKEKDVPVIYVNDNFGRWRSDFRHQVDRCLKDDVLGKELVELLKPASDDYFVLKPMHSGFFSTSLDILLRHLCVKRLVLTGFSSEICVTYTANDAYMRDYEILVPRDCVAAETKQGNEIALSQMKHWLKADIRISSKIRFV